MTGLATLGHKFPLVLMRIQNATLAQLVEQLICNQQVVSSSLTGGSTLSPYRLMVRTPGFHPGNLGSIPGGDALN